MEERPFKRARLADVEEERPPEITYGNRYGVIQISCNATVVG